MVVAIEGRRLLLGLTPVQVSLVTELSTPPTSAAVPSGAGAAGPSFQAALAKADAAGAPPAGTSFP
jgi:hypothetical protein